MSGDFRADHFTDAATVDTRIKTGENDLGEPVYVTKTRAVLGLFIPRSHFSRREQGLGEDVEAVFLTDDALSELEPPATITVSGQTYQDMEVSRRAGLTGDSMTRVSLRRKR